MNFIYLAGTLSLVIDCENLSLPSKQDQWQLQVCNQLQSEFDEVHLTSLKVTNYKVDSGSELQPIVIGDILAGRVKVEVTSEKDGQLIESRYLFSVKATRNVWVAKNKMYKGDLVQQDDFVLKKMNVAPFIGLKTFVNSNFIPRVLNKTVKKNAIFFEEYFEVKKLIAQRQIIDLFIMSGNLQIKAKGQAMESADREGDRIKVKIIETGAILMGVVKGKENVYVEI
jgi:flagella basal body P-ring formation protein FlgA